VQEVTGKTSYKIDGPSWSRSYGSWIYNY